MTRRTPARPRIRAGPRRISQSGGSEWLGAPTRYHIVSPGDLEEATRKLAARVTGIGVDARLVSE